MRTILLVILLSLLPFSAGASTATLLVYGDSLSAGFGLATGTAWPDLLVRRLAEAGLDYKVVNASVSGETTLGGMSRIARTLQAQRPAVVIIELGANDGLRGMPVGAIRDNLSAIVKACRTLGAHVLVIGMRLPPNYGSAYTTKFQAIFTDVAARYHVALTPFLLQGIADDPTQFQADGLHPVAAAQPHILDTVWQQLRPLLAHGARAQP